MSSSKLKSVSGADGSLASASAHAHNEQEIANATAVHDREWQTEDIDNAALYRSAAPS